MIKKVQFSAIVAYEKDSRGIGLNGMIPWKNKTDLKFFKKVTTGNGNNAVVMGRKTFESIGRILPNRVNMILSNSLENTDESFEVFHTIDSLIERCEKGNFDNVFVIGGSKIYQEFLDRDLIDVLYIDEISLDSSQDFDSYFPELQNDFVSADFLTENFEEFNSDSTKIQVLYRKRVNQKTDIEYLTLLNKVINQGIEKQSRAGDVLSDFCNVLIFDLKEGLPVLTSKKMYARGCITELLWFLHGETNIKYMVENQTHIWDADAYRFYKENVKTPVSMEEFLEYVKIGNVPMFVKNDVHYNFGDLGPVYGYQWRNWHGIDQIKQIINQIKNTPTSRRIMLNAWNVSDLDNMALPPCHYGAQFYVNEIDGVKYLSCTFNMRSVDTCLGLPYDILAYAILTHIIACLTDCKVDKLNCFLGDTHIYTNQISNVYKQLTRNPYCFGLPTLTLENITDVDEISIENIIINNYNSFGSIKYPLSVG